MKKIIITVLACWFSALGTVRAQFTIEFDVDTCHYLQQYEGEWRYANGADTIKMYFRYHRSYSVSSHWLSDGLCFWHEYKKGNIVVESNYTRRFDSLSYYRDDPSGIDSCSGFLGHPVCGYSSNRLTGLVTDFLQVGEWHVVTATLDTTKTVLTWKQRHREGYGFTTGAYGMTLPRQFTLIKQ